MWDFVHTSPTHPASHNPTKKTSLKQGIYIYIRRVSIQNEEVSASENSKHGEVRQLKRENPRLWDSAELIVS
jgi:hypothetical protein